MRGRRQDFLLLIVLTAATGASAVQGAESIPDFSGIWAHPYLTGFEPPAAGPGPVTNRSRRNGVGNFQQLVGDYTNPILQPAAAEVVKKHGEISLAGMGYPTHGRTLFAAKTSMNIMAERTPRSRKRTSRISRAGRRVHHLCMNPSEVGGD
jgi:hypothetical protein